MTQEEKEQSIYNRYNGIEKPLIQESIKQRTWSGSSVDTSGLNSIRLSSKQSPDSLAELVNSTETPIEAMIFIKSIKGGTIYAYTNKFYLIGLSLAYKERVQLLENFKSSNVSFFGDSAKVYQLQGIAVDYASSDVTDPGKYFHQSSIIDLFENRLRGSKLLELDSIAVLKVLNHTIEGYPMNLNVNYNSNMDKAAQFSMTWVITNHDLTLDGIVNDTRLKNLYSVSSTSDSTDLDIKNVVTAIDEFFNPKNIIIFDSTFANDKEFFDIFGTYDTESILYSFKFKSLQYDNSSLSSGYVNFLSKYLNYINTTIKNNDVFAKVAGTLVYQSESWQNDFITAVSSTQSSVEVDPGGIPYTSEDLDNKLKTILTKLIELKKTLIIYNINHLYTSYE